MQGDLFPLAEGGFRKGKLLPEVWFKERYEEGLGFQLLMLGQ